MQYAELRCYTSMLVGTRQKLQNASHFSITANQNILEDYAEVPYLSLLLSNNLSWARDIHIYITYPQNYPKNWKC